jgi:hypothetical protein
MWPLTTRETLTVLLEGVVIAGLAYAAADLLGFAAFFVLPAVFAPLVVATLRRGRGRGQEQEVSEPEPTPSPYAY